MAELAALDHRWSGGSLCVGVTPLDTPDAAAILIRAREAVERCERRGGAQVTMVGAPRLITAASRASRAG